MEGRVTARSSIADTSLLEAFTRILGLGLLKPWMPILASPAVLREHAKTAPKKAQDHLEHFVARGDILVGYPKGRSVDLRLGKRHGLSPVDLEGLKWAKASNGLLLADEREILEVALENGVQAIDIPGILRALRDAGLASAGLVRQAATALEVEGRHFTKLDAAEFGI